MHDVCCVIEVLLNMSALSVLEMTGGDRVGSTDLERRGKGGMSRNERIGE